MAWVVVLCDVSGSLPNRVSSGTPRNHLLVKGENDKEGGGRGKIRKEEEGR